MSSKQEVFQEFFPTIPGHFPTKEVNSVPPLVESVLKRLTSPRDSGPGIDIQTGSTSPHSGVEARILRRVIMPTLNPGGQLLTAAEVFANIIEGEKRLREITDEARRDALLIVSNVKELDLQLEEERNSGARPEVPQRLRRKDSPASAMIESQLAMRVFVAEDAVAKIS